MTKKKNFSSSKRASKGNFNRSSAKTNKGKVPKEEKGGAGSLGDPANTTNDWSWYAPSEAIAKSVASIPYNVLTGLPTNVGGQDSDQVNNYFQYLPNVCVLEYVNRCGSGDDALTGPNMAARQLYSFLRRNNSGARNYEAPDLMMYILAMEEIYAQYLECRRAYGILQTYSYVNRSLPLALAQALRIVRDESELQQVVSNLANYRYRLNVLRLKINSLAVPKYFKSFQRRALLSTIVLGDSTSVRSGIYAYSRSYYGIFSYDKYETGGCIEFKPKGRELDEWIVDLEAMIQAVISDDDMNTMMGDIIKAFGEGGLYSVPDVPEDFTVAINYDENLLNQLHNTQFITSVVNNMSDIAQDAVHESLDIWQEHNLIKWIGKANYPTIPQSALSLFKDKQIRELSAATYHAKTMYLNSFKDDPSYLDTLEWTRNMFSLSKITRTSYEIHCGLELFTSMSICFIGDEGTPNLITGLHNFSCIPDPQGPGQTTLTQFSYVQAARVSSFISNFDWHPIFWCCSMYPVGVSTPSGQYTTVEGPYYPLADFKVYTTISAAAIKNMNSSAVYAAYFDPTVLAGNAGK